MKLTDAETVALVESAYRAAVENGTNRIFWFVLPDNPDDPDTEFHIEISLEREAFGPVEPFQVERVFEDGDQ